MKIFRKILFLLALLGFCWFLIPIPWGVLNIGNRTGLFLCVAVALTVLFWERLKKKVRWLSRLLAVLLAVSVLWTAGLSAAMAFAASRVPPGDVTTVIVLGSQVKGDAPSLDLQRRIDTAAAYLKANPQTVCICSGGQGEGENFPESVVIRDSLVKDGISEERLYLEKNSTTTKENFRYSATVIFQKNLSPRVAVVTDEYHQFRASLDARKAGFEPYAVSASTPWFIFPACYMRELLAVTYELVFG